MLLIIILVLSIIGLVVYRSRTDLFTVLTILGFIVLLAQVGSTTVDNTALETFYMKKDTTQYKELSLDRTIYKNNYWLVDMSFFLVKTEIKIKE